MTGDRPVVALDLPAAVRQAIEAHAADAWPEECCGLLVGTRGDGAVRVVRAAPSPNRAADRRRRFEIEPQIWFDLQRALAGTGTAIVGCYHSHPDGPPEPSPRDLADAWEPGFAWLVIATAAGRVRATAAWLFEEDAAGRRFRLLALRDGGGA